MAFIIELTILLRKHSTNPCRYFTVEDISLAALSNLGQILGYFAISFNLNIENVIETISESSNSVLKTISILYKHSSEF